MPFFHCLLSVPPSQGREGLTAAGLQLTITLSASQVLESMTTPCQGLLENDLASKLQVDMCLPYSPRGRQQKNLCCPHRKALSEKWFYITSVFTSNMFVGLLLRQNNIHLHEHSKLWGFSASTQLLRATQSFPRAKASCLPSFSVTYFPLIV